MNMSSCLHSSGYTQRRRRKGRKILHHLKALGIDIPLDYVLTLEGRIYRKSQIFKAMVNRLCKAEKECGDFEKYWVKRPRIC